MKTNSKTSALIIAVLCLAFGACAAIQTYVSSTQGQALISTIEKTATGALDQYAASVASTGSFKPSKAELTTIATDSLASFTVQLNTLPANTPVASVSEMLVQNTTNDPAGTAAVQAVVNALPPATTTAQASVAASQAATNLAAP